MQLINTQLAPIFATLLAVAFPLLGSITQAIFAKKIRPGIASIVAISLSTLLSGYVLMQVWNQDGYYLTWEWFKVGTYTLTVGVLLNKVTAILLFLVCVISLPVHLYSLSYMQGDPSIKRYWVFLSYFCFAMLGLVISTNLFMMFVFWEQVGFASYLLIGFWHTKERCADANKKAFIINRIGDVGFLAGLGLLYAQYGTVDLKELLGSEGLFYSPFASDHEEKMLTISGLVFILAGASKSAQFPLYMWLPDAMEGPTSVSSLIHAATMVAAGIFLLTTLSPLFNSTVLIIIAAIGTVSILLSSVIAMAQYDIKKILAFSTIGQLGFMMTAIGIGAWDTAIFHLVTHAFFKCLLFLSAGAIIYALKQLSKESAFGNFDPKDIRNMGGLYKYMPRAFWIMTIAALALSGFPLTSGFLSKDSIIVASIEWAMEHGSLVYYNIPLMLFLGSIFTAFYISRLILKVFFGNLRIMPSLKINIATRDVNNIMFYPMMFLGICSLYIIFSNNPLSYEQAFILNGLKYNHPYTPVSYLHVITPIILMLGSLIAYGLSWRWYVKHKYPLNAKGGFIKFFENNAFIDSAINKYLVSNVEKLANGLFWFDHNILDRTLVGLAKSTTKLALILAWIDRHIIDGFVNLVVKFGSTLGTLSSWIDRKLIDRMVLLIANIAQGLGLSFAKIQNGRLRSYLGFAFSVILLGLVYLIFA